MAYSSAIRRSPSAATGEWSRSKTSRSFRRACGHDSCPVAAGMRCSGPPPSARAIPCSNPPPAPGCWPSWRNARSRTAPPAISISTRSPMPAPGCSPRSFPTRASPATTRSHRRLPAGPALGRAHEPAVLGNARGRPHPPRRRPAPPPLGLLDFAAGRPPRRHHFVPLRAGRCRLARCLHLPRWGGARRLHHGNRRRRLCPARHWIRHPAHRHRPER